jgi:hypothetical protein
MTPHPSFSSRPLFVCKFSHQRVTEAFQDLGPPAYSIGVSLTFADAYSRTLRPIDLYNVKPIPRDKCFFGAGKMPLPHLRTAQCQSVFPRATQVKLHTPTMTVEVTIVQVNVLL